MTRQDFDSKLAGSLGASLTAPAPRGGGFRAEQSSGLFDLGALYTLARVDSAAQRSRALEAPVFSAGPRSDPTSHARSETAPYPTSQPASRILPRALQPGVLYPPGLPQPVVYEAPWHAPRPTVLVPRVRRARRIAGVGWFGVAVAWLTVVTVGAMAATGVPAHVTWHAVPRATDGLGTAPVPAVATTPVANVPSPAVAAPTMPLPGTDAACLAPTAALVTTSVFDLPEAPPAGASKRTGLPPRAKDTAPPQPVAAHAQSAAAPPPAAAPAPAPKSTPPRVAAVAAVPATPAPPPKSSGPLSLDDMIRRVVAEDAKKKAH